MLIIVILSWFTNYMIFLKYSETICCLQMSYYKFAFTSAILGPFTDQLLKASLCE